MVRTCNLKTQEVETEGSGVLGRSWLHSEFKISLGYRKHCHRLNPKKGKDYLSSWHLGGTLTRPFLPFSVIALLHCHSQVTGHRAQPGRPGF